MRLEGAAALVTGAGTRIGQAIAIGLAQAGCDVAIHYNGSAKGAEDTARAVRAAGRRAELLQADLGDPIVAQGLGDAAARRLNRLDVLVNSAAIMVQERVEDVTPESWNATFDLNLRAMFFVSQGAITHLRRAKGKIVNMADIAGMEPWPGYVPHSISKAGVIMLTKGLARALAPEIAVNAIAPGAVLLPDDWDDQSRNHIVETTPLKRLGSPDDVVAAVRFLLEGTDYVTGSILLIDGGRLIR